MDHFSLQMHDELIQLSLDNAAASADQMANVSLPLMDPDSVSGTCLNPCLVPSQFVKDLLELFAPDTRSGCRRYNCQPQPGRNSIRILGGPIPLSDFHPAANGFIHSTAALTASHRIIKIRKPQSLFNLAPIRKRSFVDPSGNMARPFQQSDPHVEYGKESGTLPLPLLFSSNSIFHPFLHENFKQGPREMRAWSRKNGLSLNSRFSAQLLSRVDTGGTCNGFWEYNKKRLPFSLARIQMKVPVKLIEAFDELAPSGSVVVVLDGAGRIVSFNRTAENLTGYKAEEVIGKEWVELLVPRGFQEHVRNALNSIQEEGVVHVRVEEYPIFSREGSEIYLAWHRAVLAQPEGSLHLCLSNGRLSDFNEGILNVELNSVLDSIPVAVFTVDRSLCITSINRSAQKMTGFQRDEAIGRFFRETFRTRVELEHSPLKMAIEKDCEVLDWDMMIFTKDNREISITVSSAPLYDQHGKIRGGVAVCRDLSFTRSGSETIPSRYCFQNIVSKNKRFLDLLDNLPHIAASDATVLITGESGTGKELIASAIHNLSGRNNKPFIRVNCAGLPEMLLDSEVFGYKRGAFTDAKKDKPGRFELAEGGSIFLDEIGDISPSFQAKLLRVMETKEYEPLGGVRTQRADVRVIAATHRNLRTLAEKGSFREDLYYRLNVINLEVPPLRERREDILFLGRYFLRDLNKRRDRNVVGCTLEFKSIMMSHDYPGNVRELRNILEHAHTMCRKSRMTPDCLPPYLASKSLAGRSNRTGARLREAEHAMILEALNRNEGRIKDAATELGVHRSTIWRKIKLMSSLQES